MKKKIDSSLSEEQMVVVGSKTAGETPVSFQVLQDIYNEITGKREELEKSFRNPFELELADLEQLNIKINQMYEQYNIQSSNCSITVVYNKDTKETFSSFDRFKLLNSNSASQTERLVIKYNFLVILPKVKRPQSYEIEINISSKIALSSSIPNQIKGSFGVLKLFIGLTANVSIKYVDYLVARNFQDVIFEFLNGLTLAEQNVILKQLIRNSHWVPRVFKYSMSILSLYFASTSTLKFIPVDSGTLNELGSYLLISSFIVFLSYRVGHTLGRIVEDSLDEYQEISYIKLTKGDEKLIKKAKKQNKRKIIIGCIATLSTLLLGILSSIIAHYITS
ncbi:hypothetical protein VU04_10920 [Desulfobulbus sp. TB]|nr:hypothetical protein [Desulfobulbus sp. TB]